METDDIRAFCMSICEENEDGRDVYVRMRTGKGRSRASTIASGIRATGEDPIQLAYDLERRYKQLASETPVWLEGMLEGTSKVIDTLKLPPCEAEPETAILPHQDGTSQWGVELVSAIVEMSRDANSRATETMHMLHQSQFAQMKTLQALFKEQAERFVLEQHDARDNVSEALQMIGPLVGPVVAKMTGSASSAPPLPGGDDAELDYEVAADQMVDGLTALAAERPDLITPERISKLASLVS